LKKIYKVLFLFLPVFIFIGCFLFRKLPAGMDSYFFMNYIYGITNTLPNTPFISSFIFSIIPSNIFVIKLIMVFCILLTLFIFYKIINLFIKDNYLSNFILLSFPFWILILIRFEDDLLGLPLVFASIYYALRYAISLKRVRVNYYNLFKEIKLFDKNIILSMFFLLLAVFTWKFAVYMIPVIFLITFHPICLLAVFSILPFTNKLIGGILPNLKVSENMPFLGLLILALGFGYFKQFRIKETWYALIFLSILTIINYKFIFLCVPFLLINNLKFYEVSNIEVKKIILVYFSIFFLISCAFNFTEMPNKNLDDLLDTGYSISQNNNLEYNINWGYGYYALFRGYDTTQFGHYQKYNKEGIVLTYLNDKNVLDCKEIKRNRNGVLVNCN